jgi:aldehyde:ferredoxin oxidoreductase
MGKLLWVDLSAGVIKNEILDEQFCRSYIGGYGFGARIILDRQKPGADPLGPEAIFGIATGVVTGTPMFSGSRYTVVGKSPLTGGWGDANSGGAFGPHLKFAGYDGVFFTGISPKPVYLFINNGKAELRDASGIWGKDTFETEDILRAELGKDVEVASIGPAGEKLALISCVMNNKGRAAGRSGLGAVMGSKKLKAIAVKGDMKIPLFNEELLGELRKKYLSQLGGPLPSLREFGTAGFTQKSAHSGDSPVKNWGGVGVVDFPHPETLAGNLIKDQESKKYACYRCPIGCGGHMKAGTDYQYENGAHKPEYETMAMFGSNCLNNNLESIIKANDICNRYGVDTISAGASIAFTIECYENGLIDRKDTGGLEMTWGNHKAIVAMTEKLVRREGFGDVIADGVKKAAERIDRGAEKYAMHIQGEELPAHDPKLGFAWGITYRLDPTPARHTQGPQPSPPGLMPPFDRTVQLGRGKAHKIGTNMTHFLNSSGMCSIALGSLPNVSVFVEFINAITGWNMTMDEVLKTGERIGALRMIFNLREGLNPLLFEIPGRVIGNPPKTAGPTAGVTVNEAGMDKEFLTEMDWDLKTCKPSQAKLLELGLGDLIKVVYG